MALPQDFSSGFVYSQHTEKQRHELVPSDIRSFDVREKRTPRPDDSILLRHMDDVVGTGPEEHLMSDIEHVKTSLYLTDVVLRTVGDTVNFWVLRSPRQTGASR